MNDRFKFRVWDKENKYFIKDKSYPIGSDYSLVLNQNGELFKLGLGDYNCSDIHSWGIFEKCKNFEVVFCTGLKDSNKKDIYEGDIVKDTEDKLDTIYKIGFKKGAFFLENDDVIAYFHELRSCFSENRLEIIGNIYTTPELLEGKE